MVLEQRTLSSKEMAQLTPAAVPLAKFVAAVDAFGYHLNGIMLLKRLDSSIYRIGFVSQIGMSIFVFDIGKEHFELISCMDELNDSRMIELVRSDVGLMLFQHDPIEPADICREPENPLRIYAFGTPDSRTYCYIDSVRNRLVRTETASDGEKVVRIDYSDYREEFPADIRITHYDVPLEIHLTLMDEER